MHQVKPTAKVMDKNKVIAHANAADVADVAKAAKVADRVADNNKAVSLVAAVIKVAVSRVAINKAAKVVVPTAGNHVPKAVNPVNSPAAVTANNKATAPANANVADVAVSVAVVAVKAAREIKVAMVVEIVPPRVAVHLQVVNENRFVSFVTLGRHVRV